MKRKLNWKTMRAWSTRKELVILWKNLLLTKGTLANTDKNEHAMLKNHELDLQIDGMIEKNEGLWRCKVCGKTNKQKIDTKRHAEAHIEGVSHACHICRKLFQPETV